MFSTIELEIELFCRGVRIGPSCEVESEGRRISRTRAGLGSGLELVLPGPRKEHWVNVPLAERFAQVSPLVLHRENGGYHIHDERDAGLYPVRLPAEPAWYGRATSSGVEMSRIGVLQGNYLGVYVSNACLYWAGAPSRACKFCTIGKNVGVSEIKGKRVEDVVEVALAARDQSGSIFTHLNTGYHLEDLDGYERIHGLRQCEPFVRAIRQRVGGFIGVQCMPVPSRRFAEYDDLIVAGADHFSFCYEFEDPEYFALLCPGKAQTLGQRGFFDAMEYTAKKLGRGRVSGEIIAGLEPVAATKRGIDRIVSAGAFPTVCIFRPTTGSELENTPAPDPEAMKEVFAHLWTACRKAGLPVGILPIEVSLVVQPEETRELVPPSLSSRAYGWKLSALRQLARPYVSWKRRPAAGARVRPARTPGAASAVGKSPPPDAVTSRRRVRAARTLTSWSIFRKLRRTQ